MNGLRGTVYEVKTDVIIVKFHQQLHPIKKQIFSSYSVAEQKVVASRQQFPLKLAYCLTVHRAQGQSLETVQIDCYGMNFPGQVGVAVGRAVETSGLRVLNYNKVSVKHPYEVVAYYNENKSSAFSLNAHCCSAKVRSFVSQCENSPVARTSLSVTNNNQPDPCVSSASNNTNQVLPEEHVIVKCPHSYMDILDDLLQQTETTKSMGKINLTVNELRVNPDISIFVDYVWEKCEKCFSNHVKKSGWSSMYREFSQFVTGEIFIQKCKQLFKVTDLSKVQNKVCCRIAKHLLEKAVAAAAACIEEKQQSALLGKAKRSHEEYSDTVRGKIRYIAGSCIAVTLYRMRTRVERLQEQKEVGSLRNNALYIQQKILSKLKVSEAVIKETSHDIASLVVTEKQQQGTRGLINVHDDTFMFFLNLHSKIQAMCGFDSFNLNVERLHFSIRNHILQDEVLLQDWINLFDEAPLEGLNIEGEMIWLLLDELFEIVVGKYINILFSDNLHLFKESIPRRKKQALRPHLQSKFADKKTSKANPEVTN